jgi:hypothetical protein
MKRYKYLIELLNYLFIEKPDENCINYLIKIFNTLVRIKS